MLGAVLALAPCAGVLAQSTAADTQEEAVVSETDRAPAAEEETPAAEESVIAGSSEQEDLVAADGGFCGENATWTISSGTLNIVGSGEITAGDWSGNASSITVVRIGSGITSIGAQALENLPAVTTIYLPSSLTSISPDAFMGDGALRNIYYYGSAAQWKQISGAQIVGQLARIHPYSPVTQIQINNESGNTDYTYFINQGEAVDTLYAMVFPGSAWPRRVTWSSSDENVAWVAPDGALWVRHRGTATVTATAESGVKTSITVRGVRIRLSLSGTIVLGIGQSRQYAFGDLKNLTWTSSDSSKIRANQDGTLTGVSIGTATVRVRRGDTTTATSEVICTFQDLVSAAAWKRNAANWGYQSGITSGTSRTKFSPDRTCTREQIVTFLYRSKGSPAVSGGSPFTDVKSGYYYNAVRWARQKGITSGVSGKRFGVGSPCTRAQIVTFLWRAAGSPKVSAANPFRDVKSGSYYYNAVLWAAKNGITTGTSAKAFSPDSACTRAQALAMLSRID